MTRVGHPSATRRATARLGTVLVLAGLAALAGPGLAWAHAGGLTSASNEPAVLGLDPPTPGVRLTVVEAGARLRLDNASDRTVAVVPPPGTALDTLPVVAPGGSALWADPRVAAAAAVARPPSARRGWTIPLRVGEEPVAVSGEQYWPPPPDAPMWWLLAALAAVAPAGAIRVADGVAWSVSRRRDLGTAAARGERARVGGVRGDGTARFGTALVAVATVVVIGAHVAHLWGSTLVVAEGSRIVVFLSAAGFAVLAWPLGLVGAWLAARGRAAGTVLCCGAGALIAVVIAPADVLSFHDAVIPFAWSPDLDRALVVLTVGGGLGVVGAAWLLMRRPVGEVARVE